MQRTHGRAPLAQATGRRFLHRRLMVVEVFAEGACAGERNRLIDKPPDRVGGLLGDVDELGLAPVRARLDLLANQDRPGG